MDKIFVNKLVHTYVSLLHVPYQNPQSDVYTTDFRVINGEVIYTVHIGNYTYFALLDTCSNVSIIKAMLSQLRENISRPRRFTIDFNTKNHQADSPDG
jgi:hypothetical protein